MSVVVQAALAVGAIDGDPVTKTGSKEVGVGGKDVMSEGVGACVTGADRDGGIVGSIVGVIDMVLEEMGRGGRRRSSDETKKVELQIEIGWSLPCRSRGGGSQYRRKIVESSTVERRNF